MYYLPTKESLRLDLNARKVNAYSIPIKINAMVLLDCDKGTKVRDLKVYAGEEVVYQSSSCVSPVVLDGLKPGNYRASFKRQDARKKKSFVLNTGNKFFHDIQFAKQ
jgi:hypothetical protein